MISFDQIGKTYPIQKNFFGKPVKFLHALRDFTADFEEGIITGIVGESGSGKTTLARILTGLVQHDRGHFQVGRFDSRKMSKADWTEFRREVQMVFQDPYGSLNPGMTIAGILKEPFDIHRKSLGIPKEEENERLRQIVDWVGLGKSAYAKYPHEFSGGQRQRIGIARALMLYPRLLVLDEPVSALDVSIQAQILNLLLDLKEKLNLTYLFIAHDLGVVHYMAERIAVMYGGRLVEYGPTQEIFRKPRHPYTKMLIESIPEIGKPLQAPGVADGDVAKIMLSEGCPYAARCSHAAPVCREVFPEKTETPKKGSFWCHAPL